MCVTKFITGVFRLGKCVFLMSELICSSYIVLLSYHLHEAGYVMLRYDH